MASKYWIKLYHEILDDHKMGVLPDNLWRRAIELFLLAGEVDQDGLLPSTNDIAWKLRQDIVTIRDELLQLCVTGILEQRENDTWFVCKFAERQAAVPDKERKQRQRDRERRPKYQIPPQNGHNKPQKDVTNCDIDTDTDINQEEEKEEPPKPTRHNDFGRVCTSYQYEIGGLSGAISNTIDDDLRTYPADWIIEAMGRAARANIRRYDYVQGILKNWQVIGGPQNDKPRGDKTNGTHKTASKNTNGQAPGSYSPVNGESSSKQGGVLSENAQRISAAIKRQSRGSSNLTR